MRKLALALAIASLLALGFIRPGAAQSILVLPNGCGTAKEGNAGIPYLTVDNSGKLCNNTSYALGQSITGNAAGTTGAVVGTLAAASGKTTYICGFSVDAIGGTAAVGPITVAGLVGSSMVFQLTSSATGAFRHVPFSPCIPASAANTAITTTTTADGSASAVNVNSWGYQQ